MTSVVSIVWPWGSSKQQQMELVQTSTPVPICWETINEDSSEETAGCEVEVRKFTGFHTLPVSVASPSKELANRTGSKRPRKRRRVDRWKLRKKHHKIL